MASNYNDLVTSEAEKTVECPYNRAHILTSFRLAKHLEKCRRSYTGNDIKTCKFNVTHRIQAPEYKYHTLNCPDRQHVLNQIVATTSIAGAKRKSDSDDFDRTRNAKSRKIFDNAQSSEREVRQQEEEEENWDDCTHETYDPKKYLENSNLITHIQHMTKAQREEARLKRERQVIELESRFKSQSSTSVSVENNLDNNSHNNAFNSGNYDANNSNSRRSRSRDNQYSNLSSKSKTYRSRDASNSSKNSLIDSRSPSRHRKSLSRHSDRSDNSNNSRNNRFSLENENSFNENSRHSRSAEKSPLSQRSLDINPLNPRDSNERQSNENLNSSIVTNSKAINENTSRDLFDAEIFAPPKKSNRIFKPITETNVQNNDESWDNQPVNIPQIESNLNDKNIEKSANEIEVAHNSDTNRRHSYDYRSQKSFESRKFNNNYRYTSNYRGFRGNKRFNDRNNRFSHKNQSRRSNVSPFRQSNRDFSRSSSRSSQGYGESSRNSNRDLLNNDKIFTPPKPSNRIFVPVESEANNDEDNWDDVENSQVNNQSCILPQNSIENQQQNEADEWDSEPIIRQSTTTPIDENLRQQYPKTKGNSTQNYDSVVDRILNLSRQSTGKIQPENSSSIDEIFTQPSKPKIHIISHRIFLPEVDQTMIPSTSKHVESNENEWDDDENSQNIPSASKQSENRLNCNKKSTNETQMISKQIVNNSEDEWDNEDNSNKPSTSAVQSNSHQNQLIANHSQNSPIETSNKNKYDENDLDLRPSIPIQYSKYTDDYEDEEEEPMEVNKWPKLQSLLSPNFKSSILNHVKQNLDQEVITISDDDEDEIIPVKSPAVEIKNSDEEWDEIKAQTKSSCSRFITAVSIETDDEWDKSPNTVKSFKTSEKKFEIVTTNASDRQPTNRIFDNSNVDKTEIKKFIPKRSIDENKSSLKVTASTISSYSEYKRAKLTSSVQQSNSESTRERKISTSSINLEVKHSDNCHTNSLKIPLKSPKNSSSIKQERLSNEEEILRKFEEKSRQINSDVKQAESIFDKIYKKMK